MREATSGGPNALSRGWVATRVGSLRCVFTRGHGSTKRVALHVSELQRLGDSEMSERDNDDDDDERISMPAEDIEQDDDDFDDSVAG